MNSNDGEHLDRRRAVALVAGLLLALLLCSLMPVAAHAQSMVQATDVLTEKATGDSLENLPPGLAPVLARALAAELPASYHVQVQEDGLMLANAAHNLQTSFANEGPAVQIAGSTWDMQLRAWGYAGALQPVAAARPAGSGTGVEYDRGQGLTEWYLNSGWGLEQGFTLAQPPAAVGKPGAPLILELALNGDLVPSMGGDNTLLLQDAAGNSVLRYTGLHAWDAEGLPLDAAMELADASTLRIRVAEGAAAYPLTIDPWIQSAKLTATDGVANDYFGNAVSISGDTVVVGAFRDDSNMGSAYLFEKPGSGWTTATQSAKLTASDGTSADFFGRSVSISGDTVVAGAEGDDLSRGSAYIFQKPGSGWADATESAKLTASDRANADYFGASVSIHEDTVVVGASDDDFDRGSAYLFEKPGSGWTTATENAKLTASDGEVDDYFGESVSIHGDTVVVGAFKDDAKKGSAYLFEKPGSGWASATESAKLTASDRAANDFFGASVSISGDTVVVGAYGDDSYRGSAYIFEKPGSGWTTATENAKLTASDRASYDKIGASVSISGDMVVAGAYGDDASKGSAYIFEKPGSGWATATESAKLIASDGAASDNFGNAVSISGDTVVVGAYLDDSRRGSAYIFEETSPGIRHTPAQPGVAPGDPQGGSTLLHARVMPPVAGTAVNFTIVSDVPGDSLSSDSALTDADGLASVTYTAGSTNSVVRIDATVDGTTLSDAAYVYVSAGTLATTQRWSVTGEDSIANSSISATKHGSGTPWFGVARFVDNPCLQSSQDVTPMGPFCDVLIEETSDVDSLEIAVSYTAGEGTPTLAWCNYDGQWQTVEGGVVDDIAGTVNFTVTGDSTPSLEQLNGTPVVVNNNTTLAVTLAYFQVEADGSAVDFIWQTAAEHGVAGFHLYAEGETMPLNSELIASPAIDSLTPTAYSHSASTTASVFYLEEVRIDDSTQRHGPFGLGQVYGVRENGMQSIFLPVIVR